jgi:purine-binding chemotaxis protein CheW
MNATLSPAGATGMAAPKTAMSSQYLIFSLGGELFAVGTLRVREIIEYGNITSVPMMPGFIRGVINLRGAVVPVIDLNARFGRSRTEISRRTCIVILEVQTDEDTHVLGIVVDTVSAVRQIDASQIEPSPSFGSGIRSDFIEGMAKINGQFVILMDLGRVLSVEEISMLQGMSGGAGRASEG